MELEDRGEKKTLTNIYTPHQGHDGLCNPQRACIFYCPARHPSVQQRLHTLVVSVVLHQYHNESLSLSLATLTGGYQATPRQSIAIDGTGHLSRATPKCSFRSRASRLTRGTGTRLENWSQIDRGRADRGTNAAPFMLCCARARCGICSRRDRGV